MRVQEDGEVGGGERGEDREEGRVVEPGAEAGRAEDDAAAVGEGREVGDLGQDGLRGGGEGEGGEEEEGFFVVGVVGWGGGAEGFEGGVDLGCEGAGCGGGEEV